LRSPKDFTHPQERVFPEVKEVPKIVFIFPQSHLQIQEYFLVFSLKTGDMAVNLPNFYPVKSLKFLYPNSLVASFAKHPQDLAVPLRN
jgi:hypothetical protein